MGAWRGLFLLMAGVAAAETVPFRVVQGGWERLPQPGGEPGLAVLQVEVEPGWHVNAPNPKDPFLIPTKVELALPQGWSAQAPQFPPSASLKLEVFDEPVELLEGSFWVRIPVTLSSSASPAALEGFLEAQACNNTSCLPPKRLSFAIPWGKLLAPPPGAFAASSEGAPPSATQGLAASFAGAAFWLQLVLVFLGGLALNLTPCVYPIIPVTVGFFLQQTGSTKRTAVLAAAYVLGMAVTYSTLGVVAALTGKLFGAALQSPWVTGFIVLVVLALAASMFGLWEIRVPQSIANLAGGRQGVFGAMFMGLVVGLVAAPCIGPFVLGLLAYVGQKQSVALGFSLFFTLALGLGLPYLFLALSTRLLEKLPHSGAWMEGVRELFGVALVALAAYFARPLLPAPIGDQLVAATLVLGGLYLALLARPGREVDVVDRFMRAATLAMVVAGVLLWPRPAAVSSQELAWEKADLATVREAIASGMPVIVDFYADWCLPCRELDEKTFAHPEVREKLASFRRLKVDLTTSSRKTEELRRVFDVVGVPTVAFFNHAQEVAAARLSGFEEPRAFLRRLDLVLGASASQ
jgi:thiol:disulfide interchange protein DsbD